jgi:hypothetical protein
MWKYYEGMERFLELSWMRDGPLTTLVLCRLRPALNFNASSRIKRAAPLMLPVR